MRNSTLLVLFQVILLLGTTNGFSFHSTKTNRQQERGANLLLPLRYAQEDDTSSGDEPSTSTTDTTDTTTSNTISTHIILPGGGIFFNWQGGVISYLREQGYDLSKCAFTGSSAGSMVATFAATGVDFNDATTLALKLAGQYQVWDRPEGLQGVLHYIIEEWLDALLPTVDDCNNDILYAVNSGRLCILVTPVPFLWEKERVMTFESRQDLMDCNLASIYLPFFSDGGLWSDFRNRPYIDGNFLSTGKHYRPEKKKGQNKKKHGLRPPRTKTLVLNWQKDPFFAGKGEKDLVATITPDAVWGLVERGKEYAAIMEQKGKFKNIPKL